MHIACGIKSQTSVEFVSLPRGCAAVAWVLRKPVTTDLHQLAGTLATMYCFQLLYVSQSWLLLHKGCCLGVAVTSFALLKRVSFHPHAVACRWSWCLPCGFGSIIPYFYVIYFAVLLGKCEYSTLPGLHACLCFTCILPCSASRVERRACVQQEVWCRLG